VTALREIAMLPPAMLYARIGDAFGWACVLLLGAWLWRARRR
jgi:hypothetical protein